MAGGEGARPLDASAGGEGAGSAATPASAPRRLVITADDLGRDPRTDEAVLSLVAEGRVTAATVIPVAPGAADAVRELTRRGMNPRLHVTLTSEAGVTPWSSLSGVRSLADAHGRLPHDPARLEAGAVDAEVYAEVTAQLDWLRAHVDVVVAMDSHAGTLHGFGGRTWLPGALALCARNGLGFRLPRRLSHEALARFGGLMNGDASPPDAARGHPNTGDAVASERLAALAGLHEAAVSAAERLGVPLPETVVTNPRSAAQLGSAEALLALIVAELDALPPGTSELFLHPASPGAPGADEVRAWELAVLRDPRFSEAIAERGILLVSSW